MHHNLISFSGIFLIAGLALIFSRNKRNINWHLILWGIGFQILFAFIIFQVPSEYQNIEGKRDWAENVKGWVEKFLLAL